MITTGGFRVGPRGPRAPLFLRINGKITNTDIAGKSALPLSELSGFAPEYNNDTFFRRLFAN